MLESLQNLRQVGTVTRSTPLICKRLAKGANADTGNVILELGAGDGVITKHILEMLPQQSKLLALEINPKFCDQLRKINDDRLVVIQDSAEKISSHLKAQDIDKVDGVVSTLPLVGMPRDLGRSIVNSCYSVMKSGSSYSQIHYSMNMRKIYKEVFDEVKIGWEVRNVPPAFVFICKKR